MAKQRATKAKVTKKATKAKVTKRVKRVKRVDRPTFKSEGIDRVRYALNGVKFNVVDRIYNKKTDTFYVKKLDYVLSKIKYFDKVLEEMDDQCVYVQDRPPVDMCGCKESRKHLQILLQRLEMNPDLPEDDTPEDPTPEQRAAILQNRFKDVRNHILGMIDRYEWTGDD